MKIITTIVGALIGAGLLAAVPAHAQPTPSARPGCVTLSEARATLGDTGQSVAEVENGITARYRVVERAPGAVWRSYQPCGGRDTFLHVIYAKRANGNYTTIYWNYTLLNRGGRTVADSGGAHAS